MTDPRDLDSQRNAYRPEFRFFDENAGALRWYAERLADLCGRTQARSVLSLGIGQGAVCARLLELLATDGLAHYAIVEGSRAAIAELPATTRQLPGFFVYETLFERLEISERFDVIEMGFVLEHVDDPAFVLERYREFLEVGGTIAVAVPNACSLHRLIGHEAGLLPDLFQLSPDDRALGHQRYFDLERLRSLARKAGLAVRLEEGIFLKPVTTAQLASLQLSEAVREGLFRVAKRLPAIANAIYLELGRG